MDKSDLSYHAERSTTGLAPVRYQWLYTLSLKASRPGTTRPDALAGKLLVFVVTTILCKRACRPSHEALGRMFGRHARSIARSVHALRAAGLIEVKRRGRKLSNVYRLTTWLWRRLTNDRPRRTPPRRRPVRQDDGLSAVCARVLSKFGPGAARGAPAPA